MTSYEEQLKNNQLIFEKMPLRDIHYDLRAMGLTYNLPKKDKSLLAHYFTSIDFNGQGCKNIPDTPELDACDITNDVRLPSYAAAEIARKEPYFTAVVHKGILYIGTGSDIGKFIKLNTGARLVETPEEMQTAIYDDNRIDFEDDSVQLTLPATEPVFKNAEEPVYRPEEKQEPIEYMDVWSDYDKASQKPVAVETTPKDPEQSEEETRLVQEIQKQSRTYEQVVFPDWVHISYSNQLPWGYLHPDSPKSIHIDGIKYPSISHYLYSAILSNEMDRAFVRNTVNVVLAKTKSENLYKSFTLDITRNAIYEYYTGLMVSYPDIKQLLENRKGVRFFDVSDRDAFWYNSVLASITGVEPSEDSLSVFMNTPLHPMTGLSLQVDSNTFPNANEYVRYKVALSFKRDPSDGSSIQLYEESYLITKIQELISKVIEEKKVSDETFLRLLVTAPGEITIKETYGFLSEFIAPHYSRMLEITRYTITTPPFTLLEYSNLMNDDDVLDWVKDRLGMVLMELKEFENRLTYRLDTYHIQQWIQHFHPCTVTDTNLLISQPPRIFHTLVLDLWMKFFNRKIGPIQIYELWKLIASILYYDDQFKRERDPPLSFIRASRMNIPNSFSANTIKMAVKNATNILEILFQKVPGDLDAKGRMKLIKVIFSGSIMYSAKSASDIISYLYQHQTPSVRSKIYLFL